MSRCAGRVFGRSCTGVTRTHLKWVQPIALPLPYPLKRPDPLIPSFTHLATLPFLQLHSSASTSSHASPTRSSATATSCAHARQSRGRPSVKAVASSERQRRTGGFAFNQRRICSNRKGTAAGVFASIGAGICFNQQGRWWAATTAAR